ncbi:MAG: hypothetical protein ACLUGU_04325 [Alistipes shahii]
MKAFDLEAAKRGAAVCTRGGLPVEFSHITNSAYLPVRVLVYGDPKKLYSEIGAYLENGQMYPDIASEDDLMMRDDDYLEKLERGEYGNHIEDKREMIDPAIKQNLNTDREYWRRVYAGQAMQGEISGCLAAGNGFDGDKAIPGIIAKSSVMIADALIEELEKDEKVL